MSEETLKKHMDDDAKFQAESTARDERLERVLFGDKTSGEIGMKAKVDAMYELLVQSRGVIGFFGGMRGIVLTAVAFGALIGYLKGWFKI